MLPMKFSIFASQKINVRGLSGKIVDTLATRKSKKVQVGKDQEKAQSEKDSHSKSVDEEVFCIISSSNIFEYILKIWCSLK